MERLTERIKRLQKDDLIVYTNGRYEDTIPAEMTNDDIRAVLKKLADYEDLEEQGLLVRLPVAIGSKVYTIFSFFDCIYNYDNCKATQKWKCEEDIPCKYEKKLYCVKEIEFDLTLKDAIGKTVFLTREEAEKKLEEMKKDGE